MPATYEFTFLPSGRVTKFHGSRGNYYEFNDGSQLEMQTAPAWCRHCGKITHGEDIESLAAIETRLADLSDPDSELHRRIGLLRIGKGTSNPWEKQIEETTRRKHWREGRLSPPKCIICGSPDIVIFPFDKRIPHPADTGEIELRCIGMCSTNFNEWFFTPEGDRIPRETRPTYWKHPAGNLFSAFRDILGKE